ncbi:MAG: ABC transporter permease [Castellaniella sp.]
MQLELIRWVYRLKTVWAVLLSLLVGAWLIRITGHDPIESYKALFVGAYGEYWGFSATLTKMSPLLLAGLAVALPYRVGLFNVGGEGQIYIGALFSTLFALWLPGLPMWLAIPGTIAVGMLGGALWALIPAILKAYRNLNEVIITLLMNYIAINLVSFAVGGPLRAEGAPYPYSDEVGDSYLLPIMMDGTDAHIGALFGVLAAFVIFVVLKYTSIGFGMNTVGANPHAALYAGLSVRRHIIMSMVIGGALAGLAGTFEVIGLKYRLYHLFSDGYGYDGVVIAFLANANSLAVIIASAFMAGLESGANVMQRAVGVPITVIDAIKGLVVIFVAASLAFSYQRSGLVKMINRRKRLNEALSASALGEDRV